MADRIAYLLSQYPTISHSFILREIVELRKLGLVIETASFRKPDRPALQLNAEEEKEAARTYYVRRDARRWPLIHFRVLLQRPVAYLSALVFAVWTAKWNALQLARHLRFFAEAVIAGYWARQGNFTHVHTHFASFAAMIAGRVFGFRLSMTIHGSDEFIDPAGFCMAEKVRAAHLIIGISRYGCSQIMRFSNPADWDKVAMVRLGVNPDEFHPPDPRKLNDRFTIICVGRLAAVKAHRFLLSACAKLVGQGKPIKLVIVGGGPEKSALCMLAQRLRLEQQVEFTGAIPNKDVRGLVETADCFALASFAEGVPVVLMEAMALEVPCVATRVTGVPELVDDGVNGFLVPPADSDALADALARLIDNESLGRELGARARERVLRDYDLRQNAADLKDKLIRV